MKCSIRGCPGEYEERTIVHTVKHKGDVIVIDHVPAEVCSVCGDVLLTPETVRRIEVLLKTSHHPARNVPLYEFASKYKPHLQLKTLGFLFPSIKGFKQVFSDESHGLIYHGAIHCLPDQETCSRGLQPFQAGRMPNRCPRAPPAHKSRVHCSTNGPWPELERGLTLLAPKSSVRLMDYQKYITIEPGKRGGKPCIRGMRITVYEVLDYLASGMTEAEILADFQDLTAEDLKACLAFAADRERKLVTIPS